MRYNLYIDCEVMYMACTTLLVGKKASYDGSTMIARNEDSGSGVFTEKKLSVVLPKDQPRHYKSVLSHVEFDLPDNPMRYTAVPNAFADEGVWAAAGVNEANVSMTATETITANPLTNGADPLVKYVPAHGDEPEQVGGIGEEDIVTITLPYIHSAREGVERLGMLHEKYGTCERNGIAFQDVDEIWWFETIGGHHWMARRVPDDAYVVMPNQLGIDAFDFEDAYGEQKEYMCSADLRDFVEEYHLDLSMDGKFNPRDAFGTHTDSDHIYNTPRAWYMERYFNPSLKWEGPDALYHPESDDIPWCMVPEKKITVEDVKYILSSHYQGTKYDPYGNHGPEDSRGCYRSIGINRNNFLSCVQLRPYVPEEIQAVEWLCFGSNVFNTMVPFYANVDEVPAYYATTDKEVSTDSFYWSSRLIGALADSEFSKSITHIERYQKNVPAYAHRWLADSDRAYKESKEVKYLVKANQEMADITKRETDSVLSKVLYVRSNRMKNSFSRSDS